MTAAPTPHRPRWRSLALLALLLAPLLWPLQFFAERYYREELLEQNRQTLDLYVATLFGTLQRYEVLPNILAELPPLRALLAAPADGDLRNRANLLLAQVRRETGADVIYLMSPQGLTLTSSNWDQADSFVDRDFSYRPYFREALAGKPGRFFGLGTTSRKRGYFFSSPVRDGANVVGILVVSDIRMPGIDGLQLLAQLHQQDADLPVLLITGHGDVPLAVQAMHAGAYDFLEKPFASEALLDAVHRALELRRLVLENRSLRLALADRNELSARLIGQSAPMLRLREQVGALAAIHTDVLILGETGAGKEVVARALHDLSARKKGPFVAINAGALAESVVESELFGHEPGAFTGAQKRRIGKFEFANGGTLFLDEIESMSPDVQVKLLRLLQERVVERLGGNQLIPLDIRVIAATKEDLRVAADQRRFRADLYYRLNVAPLRIPPLRERGTDILLLFRHHAEAAAQRHGLPIRELQDGQRAQLLSHAWPGNVRELQNAAERFAMGLDLGLDLPPGATPSNAGAQSLSERVEAYEKALIAAEMAKGHTSLRSLAEALGLPRKTLHDKLRKHGLDSGGEDD